MDELRLTIGQLIKKKRSLNCNKYSFRADVVIFLAARFCFSCFAPWPCSEDPMFPTARANTPVQGTRSFAFFLKVRVTE